LAIGIADSAVRNRNGRRRRGLRRPDPGGCGARTWRAYP